MEGSSVHLTAAYPVQSMTAPMYYTKKGLAKACGVTVRSIEHHTRINTLRLNQAREKIPGLGVRFKAGLAERFIAAMQARHKPAAETEAPTRTAHQLTREEAERLLQVLSAALSAEGRNPGETLVFLFKLHSLSSAIKSDE
jgi:hypothetical protein